MRFPLHGKSCHPDPCEGSHCHTVKIKSFTLVELLIVIAILAVLAAAVVIVLNPAELLAQARDSQRISDVNMVKKAVDLFVIDNSTTSLGTANRVYISIPDSSSSCANISGLPTLPATWQYVCATSANLRNINGTGWLPLNLSLVKGGSPIPYLPIDPQNDQSLTRYYQYIPGTNTFELTALMESEKQAKAAAKDGGVDAGRLEVGSDVSLWRTASGLVGYWPFEGNGTISNGQTTGLQDISGNSNNGTASNTNGTGMTFTAGKEGSAIQLDGADDYVNILDAASLNFGTSDFSISMWVFYNGFYNQGSAWNMFIGKGATQSSGSDAFGVGTGSDNKPRFMIRETSNSTIYNTSIADGRWHHITAVRVGTTSKIYVDGNLGTDFVIAGSVSNVSPVMIGKDGAARCVNASIDEVRIYNRSLSSAEVKAVYNSGK